MHVSPTINAFWAVEVSSPELTGFNLEDPYTESRQISQCSFSAVSKPILVREGGGAQELFFFLSPSSVRRVERWAQECQRKEMKMEAGYRARTYFSGCGIRATPRKFEAISEEKRTKDEAIQWTRYFDTLSIYFTAFFKLCNICALFLRMWHSNFREEIAVINVDRSHSNSNSTAWQISEEWEEKNET